MSFTLVMFTFLLNHRLQILTHVERDRIYKKVCINKWWSYICTHTKDAWEHSEQWRCEGKVLLNVMFTCNWGQKWLLQLDQIRRVDNILEDYKDGTNYQTHSLFSQHPSALQIFYYFDDVEVCNPLGSKAKIHKISALVWL